ncbi:MAG: pyridoxamine 5'-phosphate oxidase family protein, partial [Nitrososphaerales archaeon]
IMIFKRTELDFLRDARVARLGTTDSKNRVHIVPIVFANTKNEIFFVIDKKKKKAVNLKRLQNISNNPNVTLLVDYYSEDWTKLAFLLIYCKAQILLPGKCPQKKRLMASLLQRKYRQYSKGNYLPKDLNAAIFVNLTPKSAVYWQNSRHSLA